MKKIAALIFSFYLILLGCTHTRNNQKIANDKNLNFGAYQIHYSLHGNSKSNKTLVLVHGWCSNIDVWRCQLDSFPDYKVVAIDLPGHGKSSKNLKEKYTIEVFVESLNAVLSAEKISRAFIFGHSMGFAVAEIFALKYPQKTVGIGSIDGVHFEVPNDEEKQREWKAYNNMMAESMNEEKGREDFINMLFLPATAPQLKQEIIEKSKSTPLMIGKGIISSMNDNMSFWTTRTMKIPCIAIHTPVYKLTEEYKRDFLKMYPNAEYYMIDCVSHYFMLEVPLQLNAMIRKYLAKNYIK